MNTRFFRALMHYEEQVSMRLHYVYSLCSEKNPTTLFTKERDPCENYVTFKELDILGWFLLCVY